MARLSAGKFNSFSEHHGEFIFGSSSNQTRQFTEGIHVETVKNLNDFKMFYRVPFHLYKDNLFWVAPFWTEQKDFFRKNNLFWSHASCQLFIVKKNNEAVGRIAAIIDESFCETTGEKIGFFGFFECINDGDCAQALFQVAQDWLVDNKMEKMRGPIDGRVDVGCGFLAQGFDSRSSVLSSFTPKYYLSFAEAFGMKKIRDVLLYYIDLTKPIPKRLEEKSRQCTASGITLRPFHRLFIGSELQWWTRLFLETFAEHWGYVPVSAEEVTTRFGVKQLRWIVDPRLFLVAERSGVPVAFLWATPDYNEIFQDMNGRLGLVQMLSFLMKKNRIATGKLHMIGIKKGCRDKNIASYLNHAVLVEMKKRGYSSAEVGWIDEENTAAHTTIAITGARVYKKHRVFEKLLPVAVPLEHSRS